MIVEISTYSPCGINCYGIMLWISRHLFQRSSSTLVVLWRNTSSSADHDDGEWIDRMDPVASFKSSELNWDWAFARFDVGAPSKDVLDAFRRFRFGAGVGGILYHQIDDLVKSAISWLFHWGEEYSRTSSFSYRPKTLDRINTWKYFIILGWRVTLIKRSNAFENDTWIHRIEEIFNSAACIFVLTIEVDTWELYTWYSSLLYLVLVIKWPVTPRYLW